MARTLSPARPPYITHRSFLIRVGLLLCASTIVGQSGNSQTPPLTQPANGASCHECLIIRVGLPRVVGGPAPSLYDNTFSEIKLPDGRFRGFTASATTYAMDGDHPWSMDGKLTPVLRPGAPGDFDSCGRWIQHAEVFGPVVLALVHNETGCRTNEGRKSMSLATSRDYGLTWNSAGLILTAPDTATYGRVTGEGDCTAVDGGDGFWYAYCKRPGIYATVVARAPINNPTPGQWKHFFNGQWNEPGLGGQATPLKSVSNSAARLKATGEAMLLGGVHGGIGLYFSTDHTTFTHLRDPFFPLEGGSWKRPDPSELIAYPVLIDASDGSNQLGLSWYLVYMYVQPNETMGQRYLVFRPVEVSIASQPVTPQSGILLARWYNPKLHDRWATTAAVPGNYKSYQLDGKLGYLMTAADPAKSSVPLEDCFSQEPGHPDHILEEKKFCTDNYQRLRTAGWVYSQPQENTVPLYRCYNAGEHSHFASNQPDCERLGDSERLLGYALSQ